MTAAVLRYPRLFLSLVKFEHTIFALPFAYIGAFLAVDGVPGGGDLLWITVAMVGARSLAMALNRLIDAGIDARNPRTAGRELPRGALRPWRSFCLASLVVFLVAVYQLAPIVRWLWPIPVVAFVIYPYLKRATWLSHFWLGAVDGLARSAPGRRSRTTCRWRRGCSAPPSPSGSRASTCSMRSSTSSTTVSTACTPAGELRRPGGVRRRTRLPHRHRRVPRLGRFRPRRRALLLARCAAVAGLLVYEHSLISPQDTRRLDAAFFTMNGVISVTFFAFVLLDVLA